jgi:hypothetical protein
MSLEGIRKGLAAGKAPLIILAVLGAVYAAVPPKTAWRYGVRKRWPMEWFEAEAPDGSLLTSDDCEGRPTLLVVWAAWCPYMPDNIRVIERVKMRYRSTDACIVPVSTDPKKETAFEFARSYNLIAPYYWGYNGLSDMYWSGHSTPHSFVFDRDGNLILSLDTGTGDYDAVMAAMDKVVHDGGPSLGPSPTAPGHEPGETPEVTETAAAAKQALDLFQAGDFDGLDALASQWRGLRARTALDVWKEYILYNAIGIDSGDGKATDADFEARIATFERWVAARPESVVARIALGRQWFNYAYRARGGGWDSEVTEAGRRLFVERMAKARPYLEQAEAMPGKSPVVYFTLMGVAAAQGRPDAESAEIFRKALAFEPDYLQYYENRMTDLLPRWGGSARRVREFVEASADGRGDGRGDELYARLVWDLLNGVEEYKNPFRAGYSWPRTLAGYRAMLARNPTATRRQQCAKLAVLAGDHAVAREMFASEGVRYNSWVWDRDGDFRRERRWALRESLLQKVAAWFGLGGIA